MSDERTGNGAGGTHTSAPDQTTLAWLLDSDPALRWRVERDLVGEPEEVWAATRARTATEGMGARLLALQDADGRWDGGAYFPADKQPEDAERQPWLATTWALNALRDWGVPADALGDTADRIRASARWEYDELPYWDGEVDCCINAFTIANGAWLGVDVAPLAGWFGEHRLADGGWNCEWVEGSTRSSFHSTLNSLIGLLEYERLSGDASVADVRRAGGEYLLARHLVNRLSTGERVDEFVEYVAYPFRWVATALHGLDYFLDAAAFDGHAPDPRLAEAAEIVRALRNDDGTWTQSRRYGGRTWFEVDVPVGEPSPWLTYYGTHALARWDAARA